MCLSRILAVIPADGPCMGVAAIAEASGVDRRQVSSCCLRLKARGLVERPARDCYRLTRTGVIARDAGAPLTSGPNGPLTGPRRPRRRTFRDRLWSALRALKRATIPELLAAASGPRELADDEARQRAAESCRKFLQQLRRAGYVAKLAPRRPGTRPTSNGYAIFLLVEDPGPATPEAIRKDGGMAMRDPNSGEVRALAKEAT